MRRRLARIAVADVEADLGLTDATTLSLMPDLRSSLPPSDPSLLDAHREESVTYRTDANRSNRTPPPCDI
jgi:hypothetical protein